MNKLYFSALYQILFFLIIFSCKPSENNSLPIIPKPIYDFSPVENFLAQNSTISAFAGNACILVLKDNEIIYEKSMGNLNRNSVGAVASVSKLISATAILTLVNTGQLNLDRRIGDYLPEFNNNNKGNPTIRQCFSMSSGFEECSNVTGDCVTNDQTLTLTQAVSQIAQNSTLTSSNIGNSLNYGSVGMHIVGRIVEVVTGKSWENFFKDNIATPCQMPNTNYGNVPNPLIAGGVRSSPIEVLNLLQMLLNNGKLNDKQILFTALVDELFKRPTTPTNIIYSPYPNNPPYLPYNPNAVYYGFGNWQEAINGNNIVEQIGSPGAYGTYPYIDRKRNMAVVIFNFQFNGFGKAFLTELQMSKLIRDVVDNPK
jgi:CubicO group peptidase (beta-lactamase class C family)